MDTMMNLIGLLNDRIIWGMPMVVLMIGTGIFLTIVTSGTMFTRFGTMMRQTAGTLLRKADSAEPGEGAITPFQAV